MQRAGKRAGRGGRVRAIRLLTSFALGVTTLMLASPRSGAAPQNTPAVPKSASDLVSVRLSSDVARVGPGETFHLIFDFTIKPDWHIYWQNPGETGAPTEFDIKGPNYDIGAPIFARPQHIAAPDGVTFGYEERAVVVVPVTAPDNLNDGQARFLAEVNYLVCKQVCLMGRAKLEIDIHTSSESTGDETSLEALGEKLGVSFPQPIEKLDCATATFDGTTLTLTAPINGKEKITFFPLEMPGVRFGEHRVSRAGETTHIIVTVEVKPENALGREMRVAGLIALGEESTDPCYEFDLPALVADAKQPVNSDSSKH